MQTVAGFGMGHRKSGWRVGLIGRGSKERIEKDEEEEKERKIDWAWAFWVFQSRNYTLPIFLE